MEIPCVVCRKDLVLTTDRFRVLGDMAYKTPEQNALTLEVVRACVRDMAPEADTEGISDGNLPTLHYNCYRRVLQSTWGLRMQVAQLSPSFIAAVLREEG